MKTFAIIFVVMNILYLSTFYKSTKVKYRNEPFAFWEQRWYEKGFGFIVIDFAMAFFDLVSILIFGGYALSVHI